MDSTMTRAPQSECVAPCNRMVQSLCRFTPGLNPKAATVSVRNVTLRTPRKLPGSCDSHSCLSLRQSVVALIPSILAAWVRLPRVVSMMKRI